MAMIPAGVKQAWHFWSFAGWPASRPAMFMGIMADFVPSDPERHLPRAGTSHACAMRRYRCTSNTRASSMIVRMALAPRAIATRSCDDTGQPPAGQGRKLRTPGGRGTNPGRPEPILPKRPDRPTGSDRRNRPAALLGQRWRVARMPTPATTAAAMPGMIKRGDCSGPAFSREHCRSGSLGGVHFTRKPPALAVPGRGRGTVWQAPPLSAHRSSRCMDCRGSLSRNSGDTPRPDRRRVPRRCE
jgi:hypothetical protein